VSAKHVLPVTNEVRLVLKSVAFAFAFNFKTTFDFISALVFFHVDEACMQRRDSDFLLLCQVELFAGCTDIERVKVSSFRPKERLRLCSFVLGQNSFVSVFRNIGVDFSIFKSLLVHTLNVVCNIGLSSLLVEFNRSPHFLLDSLIDLIVVDESLLLPFWHFPQDRDARVNHSLTCLLIFGSIRVQSYDCFFLWLDPILLQIP
jgi:hypothetical protein